MSDDAYTDYVNALKDLYDWVRYQLDHNLLESPERAELKEHLDYVERQAERLPLREDADE